MAEMITHNGRRYRRADAIKAGLIGDQVDVVVGTEEAPATVSAEVVDGTVDRDPAAEAAEVTEVVEAQGEPVDAAAEVTEVVEEPSTKVDDPEVTKDRKPTTTKGRGSK